LYFVIFIKNLDKHELYLADFGYYQAYCRNFYQISTWDIDA